MAEQFKFKENQRVRLKSDRADVYPFAYPGSEGIVRKCAMDMGDFPVVYIEWDKNHWTYNGESDMWTFEDHFEPVERISMSSEKPEGDFMEDLRKLMAKYGREDMLPDEEENPEQLLEETYNYMKECESFLVIGVKRESHRSVDGPILVADLVRYYGSDESGLLLEAQLSEFVASAHHDLAMSAIKRVVKERDGRS